MQRSQSGVENQNRRVHNFITTHIDGSVPFVSHAKRMVRFFFYYIHFFYLTTVFYCRLWFLDTRAEWWSSKKGRSSSSIAEFNILWYVDFQYFLIKLLFLWIFWLFSRIHITLGWRRDTRTILWPIRISIQICGWRQDCSMNPIEIECIISLTLRSRTYRRPIVFQPLDAQNRFRVLQLWNSRWF